MTTLPRLDLHAHPIQAGFETVVEDASVLAVAFTPGEWVDREERPGLVWGLGLHPWETRTDDDVASALAHLSECDAVGEVGLDGTFRSQRPLAGQREALVALLDHPETTGRLVSVHGFMAYAETVEVLEQHPTPGAVYHWFMGDEEVLRRAVVADIHFSVNHAMFALPEGRALIAAMPRTRVLIQTDSPYIERASGRSLNPGEDQTDDRPLRPGETDLTERDLAEVWGASLDEVREQLWTNLAELEGRVTHRPFDAAGVLARAS